MPEEDGASFGGFALPERLRCRAADGNEGDVLPEAQTVGGQFTTAADAQRLGVESMADVFLCAARQQQEGEE